MKQKFINLYMDWNRAGVKRSCERRGYTFERKFTASADYDNFEEFISNKYQIDIYEEMPASDLIALIHS